MTYSNCYIILLFAGLCIGASNYSDPCCPDGWVYFQSSCYVFGHNNLDFQGAENFCKHYGAHLVMIETALENTFIKNYLSDLKDPYHYIGIVDELIEGLWKWYANGNVANFTDWYSGQPNGGKGENCAVITANTGYRWSDTPCTKLYKPLCEKPSVAVETEVSVVG